MRVLVVTAMYPQPGAPALGIFVKEQVAALRSLGVEVEVLFVDTRADRWQYLVGAWRVLRTTWQGNFDVVHGHYGFAGLLARCQWRARVVVTFHGSDVNLSSQRLFSRLAARLADEVIVVSSALAARLGHARSYVIPCGVDLTLFRPMPVIEARDALGIPRDARVVLFPSSPARALKRFDRFQAAVAKLRQPVTTLLLNDVSRERVPLYLNAADCLVLTSDSEGSPVVVREALACNTPIVSVDAGDVRLQLAGVSPGAVVASTPEALAQAIQLVLDRRERSNGRSRVEHVADSTVAGQVLAVYERAVQRRRGVQSPLEVGG